MFMEQDYPQFIVENSFFKKYTKSLDKKDIKDFFLTHSSPDSLVAIKDFFLSVGLKCTGLKLPSEKLVFVPSPFIAQFTEPEEFVLVERVSVSEYNIVNNKNLASAYCVEDFFSRWNGIVLSFNDKVELQPSTRWDKPSKSFFNRISNFSFILILIFLSFPFIMSIYQFNILSLTMVTLISLSLYFSLILVKLEYGKQSKFEGSICESNKIFDCKKVLTSKISHPYNLFSLAELSFFGFSFISFSLLLFNIQGVDLYNISKKIGFIFLTISPFSAFLVIYQLIVVKRFCPFCSAVNLIVLLCALLFLTFFTNFLIQVVTYSDLIIYVISTVLALSFTSLTLVSLEKEKIVENNATPYSKLKRLPSIIESQLNQSPTIIKSNENLIFWSKKGVPNVILAINLNCIHCYKAFLEFKHLISVCPKIGLGITFIVYSNNEKEFGGFIDKVMLLYNNDDTSWIDQIDNWFSNSDFRKQNSFLPYNPMYMRCFIEWSKINGIIVSPTVFVNDKLWPIEFSIIDLSDYIRLKFS